jgi:hypothetical protein
VFAEERYYGASLPFGDQSLEPDNLAYLSTSQVLFLKNDAPRRMTSALCVQCTPSST